MAPAASQDIQPPAADRAQVVFMRSSFVGSAISSSIYELTDGQPEFTGILANATKVVQTTSPGVKTFMVVSEAVAYMVGNLLPGKTYYSIATPRMGAWKARF
jgi:hypothetical protein